MPNSSQHFFKRKRLLFTLLNLCISSKLFANLTAGAAANLAKYRRDVEPKSNLEKGRYKWRRGNYQLAEGEVIPQKGMI